MFSQEIFDSMISGRAFDKARKYLKENRKLTHKGKKSEHVVRLEKARSVNIRKMHSRNKAAFSGYYVTSADVCKECGKPAECLDHILPHTKERHIKAAAVARICRKNKVKTVTVGEFIRSFELNGQKLCATCNETKKNRENSIAWNDEYAVTRFYFAEKANKIKGFKSAEAKREIMARYQRVILRARMQINVAERKGLKTKVFYNRLRGIEKRINRELRAIGETEITL